jgi:hypothetical protein
MRERDETFCVMRSAVVEHRSLDERGNVRRSFEAALAHGCVEAVEAALADWVAERIASCERLGCSCADGGDAFIGKGAAQAAQRFAGRPLPLTSLHVSGS